MSFKLGNGNINKTYLGGSEVRKAYLGNTVVFDNSVTKYYLALNSVNQDYTLQVPRVYDFSQVGFSFGITINASTVGSGWIMSKHSETGASRIGLVYDEGTDTLQGYVLNTGSGVRSFPNFKATYSGVTKLAIVYGEGTTNSRKLYINDIEVDEGFSAGYPNQTENEWTLGGTSTQASPIPNFFCSVDAYNFWIGDDMYELNEGAGFLVTSSEGTTSTGATSNAGGLTYWDNNVWTEVFDFTSIWRTTSPNETITLPTPTNYTVDWGDNTTTTNTNTHSYSLAGDYSVKIYGDVTDFSFNNAGDKDKIISVENLHGFYTNIQGTFYGCSNLTNVEGELLGGSTMFFMFRNAVNATPNTSNWNTSNVGSMSQSFFGATNANPDTSNWDTSNVTNTSSMFYSATNANPDTSNWNTSKIIDMAFMFYNATNANPNTTNWDTSKVEFMNSMFMFASSFNQPLVIDTSGVTTMNSMFRSATSFNQPLSQLDYSSVRDLNLFMLNKTAADYEATYYDNLLIKWDDEGNGGLVFANMTNVNISMGTIRYTSAGATARANLISKGFIITDGGLKT